MPVLYEVFVVFVPRARVNLNFTCCSTTSTYYSIYYARSENEIILSSESFNGIL